MNYRVYVSSEVITPIVSPPRKKTRLIICPVCLSKGKKEVLGEIDEEGNITILRFHKGNTKIISKNFSVQCTCGEIVYHNLKDHDDHRLVW